MIVVDANVAAKWVFEEDDSGLALALLRDCARRQEEVVAPYLLPFEFTNIVRRKMVRGGLALAVAENAIETFFSFEVSILPNSRGGQEELHRRALALATTFDLPAAYDAHYLALAESLDCPLWTADLRLLRTLDGRFPLARSLADYIPG